MFGNVSSQIILNKTLVLISPEQMLKPKIAIIVNTNPVQYVSLICPKRLLIKSLGITLIKIELNY